MKKTRREFLKQATAAGAAASLALAEVRTAVAQQVQAWPSAQSSDQQFTDLARHYLLDEQVVYLNHSSIGTMPQAVFEARSKFQRLCEKNPWAYIWGGEWEAPREEVRRQCAKILSCSHEDIALTHNTTEAFNLLAQGLPLKKGDEVLFSTLNHPGASVSFFHMGKQKGYAVRQFDFPIQDVPTLSSDDLVDIYTKQITDRTRLLVFPHIDNIVGLRYPVAALSKAARARGVEFVAVDAAQSVGMLPVNVAELDVDLYATSGHKWLQASKGSGFAFIGTRMRKSLRPMWVTWGQKEWDGTVRIFEDYGTRNMADVLTLGAALTFHQQIPSDVRETRLGDLWSYTKQLAEDYRTTTWFSAKRFELGTALCALRVDDDAKKLAKNLYEEHQIVLRGFTTKAGNTLRLTPNIFTSKRDIKLFFDALG
ncbi:MAG: aminotransferase class V-fold PLP-dependent enzyme [Pseudomonadota bacterium]